ncbi:MAG: nucleotidyltransferase family protein [Candidatus Methanoperedens sp.]|nr:nucleotidyltransferase family protein [Candidatus Methanoperedens sp.]
MLTYNTILTKIAQNNATIKKYGVTKIGLFGSYLRNEQKPTSDIDILVEFEKGKITFDNYMDLKFFLEDLFQSKVDLVMEEAIKPDLKPYILGSVKYAARA